MRTSKKKKTFKIEYILDNSPQTGLINTKGSKKKKEKKKIIEKCYKKFMISL